MPGTSAAPTTTPLTTVAPTTATVTTVAPTTAPPELCEKVLESPIKKEILLDGDICW